MIHPHSIFAILRSPSSSPPSSKTVSAPPHAPSRHQFTYRNKARPGARRNGEPQIHSPSPPRTRGPAPSALHPFPPSSQLKQTRPTILLNKSHQYPREFPHCSSEQHLESTTRQQKRKRKPNNRKHSATNKAKSSTNRHFPNRERRKIKREP